MSNLDQKKVEDFLNDATMEEIGYLLEQIADEIVIPITLEKGIACTKLDEKSPVSIIEGAYLFQTEDFTEIMKEQRIEFDLCKENRDKFFKYLITGKEDNNSFLN